MNLLRQLWIYIIGFFIAGWHGNALGQGSNTVSDGCHGPVSALRSTLMAASDTACEAAVKEIEQGKGKMVRALVHRREQMRALLSLPAMTHLHLRLGAEVDSAPLAQLSDLEQLSLECQRGVDLGFIASLDRLQSLSLQGCDLPHHQTRQWSLKLTKLRRLAIKERAARNWSFISGFTKLKELSMQGLSLRDLGFLEPLVHLEEVDLSDNELFQLGPLMTLRGLKRVNLSSNRFRHLRLPKSWDKVEELNLNHNKLEHLVGLHHLQSLRQLSVRSNRLRRIQGLKGSTLEQTLTHLDLEDNRLHDVSAFEGLRALERANLDRNLIEDLKALDHLSGQVQGYRNPLKSVECHDLRSPLSRAFCQNIPRKLTEADLCRKDAHPAVAATVKALQEGREFRSCADWLASLRERAPITFELKTPPMHEGMAMPFVLGVLAVVPSVWHELHLSYQHLVQPEALAAMQELKRLSLRHSHFNDLSPLSGLSRLQELDLTGSPVRDLLAIRSLGPFAQLILDQTQITDISVLRNLAFFKEARISLRGLSLESFNPLVPRRNLNLDLTDTVFRQGYCLIQDEMNSSLKDRCERLNQVMLFRQTFVNLCRNEKVLARPYQETIGLLKSMVEDDCESAYLRLASRPSLDLSGFGKKINLKLLRFFPFVQALNLSGNQIRELGGLERIAGLRALNLSDNPLVSLEGLDRLLYLEKLQLDGIDVNDWSPLRLMPNLAFLSLRHKNVFDISVLDGMPLRRLDLSERLLANAPRLGHHQNLEVLVLNGTNLTDVSPLEDLKLKTLKLDRTQVLDLSPLVGMNTLESLSLRSMAMPLDLKVLGQIESLNTLDIRGQMVHSLRPLMGLIELDRLLVSPSQIRQTAASCPLDFFAAEAMCSQLLQYSDLKRVWTVVLNPLEETMLKNQLIVGKLDEDIKGLLGLQDQDKYLSLAGLEIKEAAEDPHLFRESTQKGGVPLIFVRADELYTVRIKTQARATEQMSDQVGH